MYCCVRLRQQTIQRGSASTATTAAYRAFRRELGTRIAGGGKPLPAMTIFAHPHVTALAARLNALDQRIAVLDAKINDSLKEQEAAISTLRRLTDETDRLVALKRALLQDRQDTARQPAAPG